jgi:enoyl-CoA hydratase/carnithine racemase
MTSLVTIERHERHAVVRLNRPEKKNAMNRDARRELFAALMSLRDGCRVVVLTGNGDSFCSGVDLKEARADAGAGIAPDPRSEEGHRGMARRHAPTSYAGCLDGDQAAKVFRKGCRAL